MKIRDILNEIEKNFPSKYPGAGAIGIPSPPGHNIHTTSTYGFRGIGLPEIRYHYRSYDMEPPPYWNYYELPYYNSTSTLFQQTFDAGVGRYFARHIIEDYKFQAKYYAKDRAAIEGYIMPRHKGSFMLEFRLWGKATIQLVKNKNCFSIIRKVKNSGCIITVNVLPQSWEMIAGKRSRNELIKKFLDGKFRKLDSLNSKAEEPVWIGIEFKHLSAFTKRHFRILVAPITEGSPETSIIKEHRNTLDVSLISKAKDIWAPILEQALPPSHPLLKRREYRWKYYLAAIQVLGSLRPWQKIPRIATSIQWFAGEWGEEGSRPYGWDTPAITFSLPLVTVNKSWSKEPLEADLQWGKEITQIPLHQLLFPYVVHYKDPQVFKKFKEALESWGKWWLEEADSDGDGLPNPELLDLDGGVPFLEPFREWSTLSFLKAIHKMYLLGKNKEMSLFWKEKYDHSLKVHFKTMFHEIKYRGEKYILPVPSDINARMIKEKNDIWLKDYAWVLLSWLTLDIPGKVKEDIIQYVSSRNKYPFVNGVNMGGIYVDGYWPPVISSLIGLCGYLKENPKMVSKIYHKFAPGIIRGIYDKRLLPRKDWYSLFYVAWTGAALITMDKMYELIILKKGEVKDISGKSILSLEELEALTDPVLNG